MIFVVSALKRKTLVANGYPLKFILLSKYFYTSIEPNYILVGFVFESDMKALNNEIIN